MTKRFSEISWEIVRKTVHLSGLLTVLGYTLVSHYLSERVAILTITAVLLVLLEIEYIRIESRPKIIRVLDGLFRPQEKDKLAGSVFYVISCIICFAAFDYWIAVLAMFMTAFGDIFAALVGRIFGKTKIFREKTLVGSLAGFTANMAIGIFILSEYPLLVLAMALTATIAELLSQKLDDNLVVPLFSGFLGQMIVYFFALPLPLIDLSFLGL